MLYLVHKSELFFFGVGPDLRETNSKAFSPQTVDSVRTTVQAYHILVDEGAGHDLLEGNEGALPGIESCLIVRKGTGAQTASLAELLGGRTANTAILGCSTIRQLIDMLGLTGQLIVTIEDDR